MASKNQGTTRAFPTDTALAQEEIKMSGRGASIAEAHGGIEHAAKNINSDVSTKDARRKSLVADYNNEPKRLVVIAPAYRPEFGNNMHVSLNGISMAIPCNGRPYSVAESFAAVVQERLRACNDQMNRKKQLSDIPGNRESTPGELRFY